MAVINTTDPKQGGPVLAVEGSEPENPCLFIQKRDWQVLEVC